MDGEAGGAWEVVPGWLSVGDTSAVVGLHASAATAIQALARHGFAVTGRSVPADPAWAATHDRRTVLRFAVPHTERAVLLARRLS